MSIVGNVRKALKNPLKRWGILLGIASVLIAVVVGGLTATCSPFFCTKMCHAMSDVASTWEKSSHSSIPCLSCHVEPGILPLIKDKIKAMPGVWKNALNSYHKPINPESEVSEEITDEICEQCHSLNRKATPNEGLIFDHDAHFKLEVTCAECHNRVAHLDKEHENHLTGEWCLEKCHNSRALAHKCTLCHTQQYLDKNKGEKPHQFGELREESAEEKGETEEAAPSAP